MFLQQVLDTKMSRVLGHNCFCGEGIPISGGSAEEGMLSVQGSAWDEGETVRDVHVIDVVEVSCSRDFRLGDSTKSLLTLYSMGSRL